MMSLGLILALKKNITVQFIGIGMASKNYFNLLLKTLLNKAITSAVLKKIVYSDSATVPPRG